MFDITKLAQVGGDPDFSQAIDDHLTLRWSRPEDTERIAEFVGTIFRPSADAPINDRMQTRVRMQMHGDHPLMGPQDYALVEDIATQQIVACACLWHHTWEYEGIPFGVGRPEYVAVDPAYRRRGLMRAVFALLHARSASLGHRVTVITGIPNFYRQFGYEYALDLEGMRVVSLSAIPAMKEGETEAFGWRDATVADIPQLMALHDHRRAGMLVSNELTAEHWHYQLTKPEPTSPAKQTAIKMLVDGAGVVVGYLHVGIKRWGANMVIFEMATAPQVNLRAMLPPILRQLQQLGQDVPNMQNKEPMRGIGFMLGQADPVYDALGPELAPRYDPPYGWYVRVPDILGFLEMIKPVLERRIAASVLASYTGELKFDWYREGVRLAFAQGQLTAIEPWQAPPYGDEAQAGCPPLVFLQLLFGYRSLSELRHAFPDVWANDEAQLLLDVLFPKRQSYLVG